MRPDTTKETLGPKVFGFWGYDLFPFVLGAPGHIITTVPRGRFRDQCFIADGYGGAAFANPVTMSIKEGKIMKANLDRLEVAYRGVKDAVQKEFRRLVVTTTGGKFPR